MESRWGANRQEEVGGILPTIQEECGAGSVLKEKQTGGFKTQGGIDGLFSKEK